MKIKPLPIISALFLVVAMTIQFFVSYRREKKNVETLIENRMELAEKKFLYELYDMYEAADEISHFFPEFSKDGEELFGMLTTVLRRFPNLYCCYVSFLPECTPERGKRYAPCAFRVKGDSIVVYDYGNKVDYLQRDWYKGALQSDEKGYWSSPYNDADHAAPVFTYSRKVYDERDSLVAVAGADYTLAWTERLLEEIKPYDDAVCQLFSTKGTLIVESDAEGMEGKIVMERTLAPTNMRLVIGVPKSRVFKAVHSISLLTLGVLLAGITIAGWLIRRIWRDQKEYDRVEMNNQLMEQELHIASRMQESILRHDFPNDEAIEVSATLIPMHEVGGDLYDFYRKGEDFYFIIGDVSGKGVPATMFMSAAVNLFRSSVRKQESPKAIVEEMNAVLSDNNPSFTFITAFVGKLHIPSGQLLYCNAGHNEPLVCRQDGTDIIPDSLSVLPNIPLGFDGDYSFVEQELLLDGDAELILYTDGITEARNGGREMFGKQRLLEAVSRGEHPVEAVKRFMGSAPQADDLTLMTILRKKSLMIHNS